MTIDTKKKSRKIYFLDLGEDGFELYPNWESVPHAVDMGVTEHDNFTVQVEGEHKASVYDFLKDNSESFDGVLARQILALEPGGSYKEGGGAWAEWMITRVPKRRSSRSR